MRELLAETILASAALGMVLRTCGRGPARSPLGGVARPVNDVWRTGAWLWYAQIEIVNPCSTLLIADCA